MKNLLRSSIVVAALISGAGTVLATSPLKEKDTHSAENRLAQRADLELVSNTELRPRKPHKHEDEYRYKPTRVTPKSEALFEDFRG